MSAIVSILLLAKPPLHAADEIKNGNFSAGLAGWNYRSFDPSKQGPSRRKFCELVEESPGNKAVQMALDSKEFMQLSQEFRVRKSQKKFTVSLRAKASADYSTGKVPSLSVYFWGIGMDMHDLGVSHEFSLKPGGDWEVFTAEMSAPTTGSTIYFFVKIKQGTGTVLIDDLVVKDS